MNMNKVIQTNNAQKRPVRRGRIRECYWFAQPENVESDASSKADFSSNGEKSIEVNLSGLPKDKRQPVWDWIQANDPGLASMLSEDPLFKDIKTAFNCSVRVEIPASACRQLGLIR
jgi:hypothetical protein